VTELRSGGPRPRLKHKTSLTAFVHVVRVRQARRPDICWTDYLHRLFSRLSVDYLFSHPKIRTEYRRCRLPQRAVRSLAPTPPTGDHQGHHHCSVRDAPVTEPSVFCRRRAVRVPVFVTRVLRSPSTAPNILFSYRAGQQQ